MKHKALLSSKDEVKVLSAAILLGSLRVKIALHVFTGADGWMTCNFLSLSTVFQSHQDDELMIRNGCVQWNPVHG